MRNLTVVGDDLTGTVDCTSLGVRYGCNVTLATNTNVLFSAPSPSGRNVLGINTCSRTLSGKEAYQIAKSVTEKIVYEPDQIILKKMDTGFRGNAAYEIEGMLEATKKDLCCILEHIPIRKTFTLYGYQFSAGQILEKSVFARDDLLKSQKESYIPDILAHGTSLPIGTVDIDAVKGNNIVNATKKEIEAGKKIIVFDVITEQDGLNIINALQPLYPNILWAGTTGIVENMLNYLYGPSQLYTLAPKPTCSICFSGTAYQATKDELNYSVERNHVTVLNLNIDRVIEKDDSVFPEILQKALAINKERKNVLIRQQISNKYEKPGVEHTIEKSLCIIASMLAKEAIYDQLLIVGGETSQAIFSTLKIGMTELYNPDIIGTGKGKILDGPYKGKDFAIKGGSIGPINVISRLLGYDS